MTYQTPSKIKLEYTHADDTLVYSRINTIDDCILLHAERLSRIGKMGSESGKWNSTH